jgi:hypothetical protein
MSKSHPIWIVAGAVLLVLAVTVGARADPARFQVGNLVLEDHGGISPQKLPRHEQVPISAHLRDRIATTDGAHPPDFRHLVADFDRTIEVHAEGLPTCAKGKLVARSSDDAKAACRGAIVGSGEAKVEVAFPEQEPFTATGPVYAFNGGVAGGVTTLYIHGYVNVPAPTAVVVTVKITRIDRGRFGIHAVAAVPEIAGGAGSVTQFELDLGRRFTYRGERRSYLTASCPSGKYYAEAQALFGNGTVLHIQHVLPCTPAD